MLFRSVTWPIPKSSPPAWWVDVPGPRQALRVHGPGGSRRANGNWWTCKNGQAEVAEVVVELCAFLNVQGYLILCLLDSYKYIWDCVERGGKKPSNRWHFEATTTFFFKATRKWHLKHVNLDGSWPKSMGFDYVWIIEVEVAKLEIYHWYILADLFWVQWDPKLRVRVMENPECPGDMLSIFRRRGGLALFPWWLKSQRVVYGGVLK